MNNDNSTTKTAYAKLRNILTISQLGNYKTANEFAKNLLFGDANVFFSDSSGNEIRGNEKVGGILHTPLPHAPCLPIADSVALEIAVKGKSSTILRDSRQV